MERAEFFNSPFDQASKAAQTAQKLLAKAFGL